MTKKLLILAVLFLLVRAFTIVLYKDYNYYYVDFSHQFAIASAAYNGHWFSYNSVNSQAVWDEANKSDKYIPIESWKKFPSSNQYSVYPAIDLPGHGYLIAYTSKYFAHELTSKYAFSLQILLELVALLSFIYCIFLVFGERTAFIAGLIYIFAYPFIWPIATQPTRDMFVLGTCSAIIAAFFIFIYKNTWRWYLAILALLIFSAVLLWVRPSSYYYFFLLAPLVFFVQQKTLQQRLIFFGLMVLVPLLIFGIPYKYFNLKYYGVANTQVLGRGLWEGMGIIKNNPYGFVDSDAALIPFIESHFNKHNVADASPEMNKILGDYAFAVIKKDPGYYFETVWERLKQVYRAPLVWEIPKSIASFLNPSLYFNFGRLFFFLGLLITISAMIGSRYRFYFLLLTSPLWYTLAYQVALNVEPRIIASAAWVLIFPLAWLLDISIKKYQEFSGIFFKSTAQHYLLSGMAILFFSYYMVSENFFDQYVIAPVVEGLGGDFFKRYSVVQLPWRQVTKNLVQITPDGLHILTDKSTGIYQVVATIPAHHAVMALVSFDVKMIKGGVDVGILGRKDTWKKQRKYFLGDNSKGVIVTSIVRDGRISLVIANAQSQPARSEFLVKKLDVYMYP